MNKISRRSDEKEEKGESWVLPIRGGVDADLFFLLFIFIGAKIILFIINRTEILFCLKMLGFYNFI